MGVRNLYHRPLCRFFFLNRPRIVFSVVVDFCAHSFFVAFVFFAMSARKKSPPPSIGRQEKQSNVASVTDTTAHDDRCKQKRGIPVSPGQPFFFDARIPSGPMVPVDSLAYLFSIPQGMGPVRTMHCRSRKKKSFIDIDSSLCASYRGSAVACDKVDNENDAPLEGMVAPWDSSAKLNIVSVGCFFFYCFSFIVLLFFSLYVLVVRHRRRRSLRRPLSQTCDRKGRRVCRLSP